MVLTIILVNSLTGGIASAQDSLGTPPIRPAVDESGVDMSNPEHVMAFEATDLTIGKASEFSKNSRPALSVTRQALDFGWHDSMYMALVYDYPGAFRLNLGTRSRNFSVSSGGAFVAINDRRETVTLSAGVYTYTMPDGTIIHFSSVDPNAWQYGGESAAGLATDMVYPSGEKLTFWYRTAYLGSVPWPRLQSVTSSYGYQIKYEYANDVTPTSTVSAYTWGRIVRVTAINNAAEYCSPTADHCPLSFVWPSVSFSYSTVGSAYHVSVTDVIGGVTAYTWNGNPTSTGHVLTSIRLPGSAVDTTVVEDTPFAPMSAVTKDGVRRTYSVVGDVYQTNGPGGYSRGIKLTHAMDPSGGTLDGHPYLISMDRDSFGNETNTEYNIYDQITKVRLPEGNEYRYSYDTRGNQTEVRYVAKPGSGQFDLVNSATFPSSCANVKICNQPITRTDGRNATTAYTYDSTHGGVLTVTSPADPSGVQVVQRYAYAERYAWTANGAGGYIRASTPIWLRTEERYCRTSATIGSSCAAGAADEVVTSYEYGPDSGPNNLWLRGRTVTADGVSLRTCYGHDRLGNKISETSPRAGLASCS